MYAKFVRAGGCTNPIRKEINPHYFDSAYADHPAVYINWEQAQVYCKWSGGSLPTEAEWERAAAGDGRREFPWGNDDPGPEQANVNNPAGGTSEVGSYPDGASPFGVLDMGSNVREWVKDWFNSSYYSKSPKENPQGPKSGEKRTLRGASWGDPTRYSRVTNRLAHQPDSPGANRGFRCAYP